MSPADHNPYGHPLPPPFPHAGPYAAPPPPPGGRRRPVWVWALLISGGLVALSCAGVLGMLMYVGSVGPDTKVYGGNEVPKRFVDVINGLKLLENGEPIRFFYSDALTDVRDGMYFVTDRKVVIYIGDSATPATVVPFGRIAEKDLVSGTSWLEDGVITLRLDDGSVLTFPVSSEGKRDQLLFDAIPAAAGDAPGNTAGDAGSTDVER